MARTGTVRLRLAKRLPTGEQDFLVRNSCQNPHQIAAKAKNQFDVADKHEMTDLDQSSAGDTSAVAVLGWVVPRPTGRWHQAIAVTSQHVWITPEISFADNEAMEAAAAAGTDAFHAFLKSSGWITRPERVSLVDIRGLNWNETTGWLRIGGADDHVIGAMIPDRTAGDRIRAGLKQAVAARITSAKKA